MKKIITAVLIIIAAAAAYIACNPVHDIEVITSHVYYSNICSGANDCSMQPVYDSIVFSWDVKTAGNKHISYERYVSRDITDAVIFSVTDHAAGGYAWTRYELEYWINTDTAFGNLVICL